MMRQPTTSRHRVSGLSPPPIPRAPWLGVYPALTLPLAILGPTIELWPLPLRTLLVSIVMVIALTWLILPFLTRVFRRWMFPSK